MNLLNQFYPCNYKIEVEDNNEIVTCYTSVEEEYNILRNEVGIIDGYGYGMYQVSGEGALELIDSLATKEIEYLNISTVSECMMLDDNGVAMGTVFIFRRDEDFIILSPSESAKSIFNRLKSKSSKEVEVKDILKDNTMIFLEGPKSWKLVKKILSMEIEIMPLRGFSEIEWNNKIITVSRIGRSGEYGYCIFAEHKIMQKIVSDCLEEDPDIKCAFCGRDAMDICMMEIRQPNLRFEKAEYGNIIELNQHWLIQYDKKNYAGDQKVKKYFFDERKCSLVGFECKDQNKIIPTDTKIVLEEELVGKVLYSFAHPQMRYNIGMALINDEIAVSGIQLAIEARDGLIPIHTLSSPYVRPISWEQKME